VNGTETTQLSIPSDIADVIGICTGQHHASRCRSRGSKRPSRPGAINGRRAIFDLLDRIARTCSPAERCWSAVESEEGKISRRRHRRGDPSGLIFKFFAGRSLAARFGEISTFVRAGVTNEVTGNLSV